VIPVINYDGSPQCPLGFNMSQNRMAVPVWSYLMELHPPARIVELGSGNGGFTTVLGIHAWRIGAKVYSFERHLAPDARWKSLAEFLGIEFFMGDLFGMVPAIKQIIQFDGPTILLCDNGNKIREFHLFAPYLKSGDIIAAHDHLCVGEGGFEWWPWREITPADIAGTVSTCDLRPFMQEHFDMTGWLVYKRI